MRNSSISGKNVSKKFTVRNWARSVGVEPTGEKYFPPEEMKKTTNGDYCSTGDFLKTVYNLITPLEPE